MNPWKTTVVVALLSSATPIGAARAQEPVAADTTAVADTTAPADTMAAADADTTDSLAEIEARLMGELGAADSAAAPARGGSGATLNPDISLIADFLVDLSPDESTLEDGDRYQIREVEIGVQGAVDPYFRYDAFLGLHGDGIELEEAYATTLALPASLQARLGRFLLPFGKVNLTHRAELPMFDYPLVHREFFGEEGFSSTGVWGSWIGAPLGFFQELSVVGAEGMEAHEHGEEEHAEAAHALRPAQEEEEAHGESLGDDLGDRLWLAHVKNSLDLTPASNLEFGGSWATAVVEEEDARARTNVYGIDVTWRWKPPQFAKYRSAILQAETIWRNEAGPPETRFGAFGYAQWQLSRRWYVGARGDWVEPPEEDGTLRGGQLLVKWFPTEFSQLRLAYERQDPEEGDALDRLIFQTTFALGPHRPHAF
ncbi:MAG TPA: hypothetical protein VJP59_08210 [Gemmatimonadota bacterium]|nr:hypothetical protein [Gemmatimonadota bacterium]